MGIAREATEQLQAAGKQVRLVSMPCCEVFEAQDDAYKEQVLPAAVTKRIAIEAGHSAIWYRYVGLEGKVIGIDRFGESAPGGDLFKFFGFTTENIVETANKLI